MKPFDDTPITHAIARRPAANADEGLTTADLGEPDLALMLRQHDEYVAALHSLGVDVAVLPADDRFPDGHFVEDPAVVFGRTAVLCNPSDPLRHPEPAAFEPALRSAGFEVERIAYVEGATVEGGDVLYCSDRVLIGVGGRTSRSGAEALRAAIARHHPDVPVQPVPFTGVLHLKTGLTQPTAGVLLRHHDLRLADEGALDFAEVFTLPPPESYHSNVLPVADGIVIAEGSPTIASLVGRWFPASAIRTVAMSEFRKMDGSLTCLSIRS